ncbi:hypothetical protein EW145_g6342 [Phellinidium pouzarii]|uniref:Carboxylic ester hydrolase n=1 Tax=Phellinidium pouzarii TaxID=167371 RepID=A0A4S4KYP5_9AGAM|nr:hypothetical protein EW145_g6342 [Phellinidium pouzarii]
MHWISEFRRKVKADEISDKGFSFLRKATANWQLLGSALSLLSPSLFDSNPAAACTSLQHDLDLSSLNTTILSAAYYNNATEVITLGSCPPATTKIGDPLCRVQLIVNTSDISAVTAEAWLPTEWNGRFLGLGNGGLGGCIDYDNLGYGSSMGFATIGTNNGHDGNTGLPFANNPESLASGLQQPTTGRVPHHAYYLGCSAGGRQGMYSAMYNPGDFDGILAGAPTTNFNHLMGASAIVTKYIGAPHPESSASFIPLALWDIIMAEMLRQCDAFDGVKDGIISEPDACEFRPEEIQCTGRTTSDCLTIAQVVALRNIYSPLYGFNGELLFPRFDPGAALQMSLFSGAPFKYSDHWMKYAIHNDSEYDYSAIGLADIALADEIDPGKISTFNGDLSAFRARGGKLISYHGRSDQYIPSGNAKALYNHVSRTLRLPASSLDAFYRLFLVPGMGHCFGGPGAVNFGQHARSMPRAPDETLEENKENKMSEKAATHKTNNVLLSLVDWVERGLAPDTITGVSDDGKSTRVHCRYPQKSVWDGGEYICVP